MRLLFSIFGKFEFELEFELDNSSFRLFSAWTLEDD
jgi:hypothetical protein